MIAFVGVMVGQNIVQGWLREFGKNEVTGIAVGALDVFNLTQPRVHSSGWYVDASLPGLDRHIAGSHHLLVVFVHFAWLRCRDVCQLLYKPGALLCGAKPGTVCLGLSSL